MLLSPPLAPSTAVFAFARLPDQLDSMSATSSSALTQRIDPRDIPSGTPIFTPTRLNDYERCPELWNLRYNLRLKNTPYQPERQTFDRPRAVGQAVHAVLQTCHVRFKREGRFPCNLRELIERRLPREGYPDPRSDGQQPDWELDVARALRMVTFRLRTFTGLTRIEAVEKTTFVYIPEHLGWPGFILKTRVDIVLADEEPGLLETQEYKTGRSEVDWLQTIATRLTIGATYGDRYPRIRTTIMFLNDHTIRSWELRGDRLEVRRAWHRLRRLVRAMLADQDWLPHPSTRCHYCQYYESGCSLDAPDA